MLKLNRWGKKRTSMCCMWSWELVQIKSGGKLPTETDYWIKVLTQHSHNFRCNLDLVNCSKWQTSRTKILCSTTFEFAFNSSSCISKMVYMNVAALANVLTCTHDVRKDATFWNAKLTFVENLFRIRGDITTFCHDVRGTLKWPCVFRGMWMCYVHLLTTDLWYHIRPIEETRWCSRVGSLNTKQKTLTDATVKRTALLFVVPLTLVHCHLDQVKHDYLGKKE